MRAPLGHDRADVGFNMTPMIDIVFQLIVFFLVASHLAQQETQVELALPRAATGRAAGDDAARRVTVNVQPDGELSLSGQSVSAADLAQRIGVEAQRHGDDLEVRIRADERVPYAVIEPILTACTQAGVWKVTFAVVRGEAPAGAAN